MIKDIIKNRRAVFPAQYNEESITKEEITAVLESANWAPTHRRTEPWRFKVFHGESQKALGEFMAETYKNTAEKFSERTYVKMKENPVKAGCIIAICMQRDPKESVPEWEEIASTAMAVQNRSEEHTSELQSRPHLVCRLLLEKKKKKKKTKEIERQKKTRMKNCKNDRSK